MTQFIHLKRDTGSLVLINVDHIICMGSRPKGGCWITTSAADGEGGNEVIAVTEKYKDVLSLLEDSVEIIGYPE